MVDKRAPFHSGTLPPPEKPVIVIDYLPLMEKTGQENPVEKTGPKNRSGFLDWRPSPQHISNALTATAYVFLGLIVGHYSTDPVPVMMAYWIAGVIIGFVLQFIVATIRNYKENNDKPV